MKTLDNVTLKWLDGDELDQLEPILAEKGWASLNKATSRALAAFDQEGKLIGWEVFQLYPYLGPAYVEKTWRGSGLYEKLADELHEFLLGVQCRGAIMIAETIFAEKLAEKHGMRKVELPVYEQVT